MGDAVCMGPVVLYMSGVETAGAGPATQGTGVRVAQWCDVDRATVLPRGRTWDKGSEQVSKTGEGGDSRKKAIEGPFAWALRCG